MREATEVVTRVKGELEGRALQVAGGDDQVVGVGHRLLLGAREQTLRMREHVLVERQAGADQDRDRLAGAPPGAPALLMVAGHAARVAGHEHRVEGADVHPELEGIGRGHHADLAGAQPALDAATQSREVAAAVADDALGGNPELARRVLEVLGEHLDGAAGAPEDQGRHALAQEMTGEACGPRRPPWSGCPGLH